MKYNEKTQNNRIKKTVIFCFKVEYFNSYSGMESLSKMEEETI